MSSAVDDAVWGSRDSICAGLGPTVRRIIIAKPATASRPRRTTRNRSRRRAAKRRPLHLRLHRATSNRRRASPFTAAEDAVATIPGMPDARFWADFNDGLYQRAAGAARARGSSFSSGGGDGAFGAGLLVGLSAAGNRPEYSVVTGVSTGALMAPFIFAGPRYDDALRSNYTKVSAADVFEAGRSSESFVDSWPLKETIAKQVTPALLDRRRCRTSSRPPPVRCDSSISTPNGPSSGTWARLPLTADRRWACAVSDRAARFDCCSGSIPARVD